MISEICPFCNKLFVKSVNSNAYYTCNRCNFHIRFNLLLGDFSIYFELFDNCFIYLNVFNGAPFFSIEDEDTNNLFKTNNFVDLNFTDKNILIEQIKIMLVFAD